MNYLASQGSSLSRQEVYTSSERMLPRDWKEELMHTPVQNRGHGAGDSQPSVLLGTKDFREGIAHQGDWEWGAIGVPVVRKAEAIPERVRPIDAVRFVSNFVVEGGERWPGVTALIPYLQKRIHGPAGVDIAIVNTLHQLAQSIDVERAALQGAGESLDTDQGLVVRKRVEPSRPINLEEGIWHTRIWDTAVPVQMQLIGLGPVLPGSGGGIGWQSGEQGIELMPPLSACPLVKAAVVCHSRHCCVGGVAVSLQEVSESCHTEGPWG